MLSEEKFKLLFNQYYDRVYTTLYNKVKSEDTAQDLTQIAFLNLWKYRESFKSDLPAAMQVYRKANLAYIDWLRKEAHQRQLLTDLKHDLSNAISHTDLGMKDELKKSIESLPKMQKKVFELAYIEGYSHKEIAEKLKISVRTVDSHIYKSLNHLRKILTLISIVFHFYNK